MDDEYKIVKQTIKDGGGCGFIGISSIYVKDKNTYVIVGKLIDVKKAGIEKILGEGDVAIEISKELVKHAP